MNRILFLVCFLFLFNAVTAQKNKADSLYKLLKNEKIDSNRVTLMWNIGLATGIYDPLKALAVSREALLLARNIKYEEGQSRSLGIIANIFGSMGNYPRALEFNLQKLKIEEKRNNNLNLASVNMNIGIVYSFLEEYNKALQYYYKADSLIEINNIRDLKFNIALNMGDVYDRLNNNDSAYSYFNKSLGLANELKNSYLIGASLVGMGHVYMKQEDYLLSLANYQRSLTYLSEVNADELLCEASLGLATLYQKLNKKDSAVYYANMSRAIAEKDGFLPKQLDALNFLTEHYKKQNRIDSAFFYINNVQEISDTINSKSRIRESQMLSSNEQFRQLEIAENKRIAKRERKQQLQLLFIGIFIPGFFMFTLLLSRIKIHIRVVKVLGVLSLLIVFEYLTLLLHPYVAEITNHTPILEMLIFVSIAAILIPTHHRIELWLIHWLSKNRPPYTADRIKLKTTRFNKKINSPE